MGLFMFVFFNVFFFQQSTLEVPSTRDIANLYYFSVFQIFNVHIYVNSFHSISNRWKINCWLICIDWEATHTLHHLRFIFLLLSRCATFLMPFHSRKTVILSPEVPIFIAILFIAQHIVRWSQTKLLFSTTIHQQKESARRSVCKYVKQLDIWPILCTDIKELERLPVFSALSQDAILDFACSFPVYLRWPGRVTGNSCCKSPQTPWGTPSGKPMTRASECKFGKNNNKNKIYSKIVKPFQFLTEHIINSEIFCEPASS